jgi:general secretion pathway protein B
MSYVLDALKKAQSQREKGSLPGINTLQLPTVPLANRPSSGLKPVLWFIAIVLVLILAALAWRLGLFGASATPEVAASAPQVAQPAPAPVVMPTPAPAPVAATPVPAPVPEPPPAAATPPEPKKKPTSATLDGPKPAPKPVPKSAPLPEPAATPETPATRVYAVSELPEAVQRELPKLAISGGAYSSNPAQRLLIVNNQVFNEKSEPSPGVVVEQIGQNSAVLSFRGYQYRVRY